MLFFHSNLVEFSLHYKYKNKKISWGSKTLSNKINKSGNCKILTSKFNQKLKSQQNLTNNLITRDQNMALIV